MAACARGEDQTLPLPFPKAKAILPLTHQQPQRSHTRNCLFPIQSACETKQKKHGNAGAEDISEHIVTGIEENTGNRAHTSDTSFYSPTPLNPSYHRKRLPKAFPICMNTSHMQLMRETGEAPEKTVVYQGQASPNILRRRAASLIICSHFNLPPPTMPTYCFMSRNEYLILLSINNWLQTQVIKMQTPG